MTKRLTYGFLIAGLLALSAYQFASGYLADLSASLVPERGPWYQANMLRLWGKGDKEAAEPYTDPSSFLLPEVQNPYMADGPYLVAVDHRGEAPRPAMLIIPGGGYEFRSERAEGLDVASWLLELGINSYILNYRVGRYPLPMQDATLAMAYLRSNADSLGIDPNRIGVMGFSAGGHVAAFLANLRDHQAEAPVPGSYDGYSSRPDFAVLAYPVISFVEDFAHDVSRTNLIGQDPPPDLRMSLSMEKHVTKDNPPAFIWAPESDPVVDYRNALAYADALSEVGVSHRLHVFADGYHGSALAQSEAEAGRWLELLAEWLNETEVIVR